MRKASISAGFLAAALGFSVATAPSAAAVQYDYTPNCTNVVTVATHQFDNPYKANYQHYGTLRLRTGWCGSSGTPWWNGAWGDATLKNGGTIKVRTTVYNLDGACCDYSLSNTGRSDNLDDRVVGPALETSNHDGFKVEAIDPSNGKILSLIWKS